LMGLFENAVSFSLLDPLILGMKWRARMCSVFCVEVRRWCCPGARGKKCHIVALSSPVDVVSSRYCQLLPVYSLAAAVTLLNSLLTPYWQADLSFFSFLLHSDQRPVNASK
jgi:hypothetical protein